MWPNVGLGMTSFLIDNRDLRTSKFTHEQKYWSDFTIPDHLLTYLSKLLRTKHVETKVTIQIQ